MSLINEIMGDELGTIEIPETLEELDRMENSLEELSLSIISILKDYREKGLIGEDEYKKHTKIKKEYLAFLKEKRKSSAAI